MDAAIALYATVTMTSSKVAGVVDERRSFAEATSCQHRHTLHLNISIGGVRILAERAMRVFSVLLIPAAAFPLQLVRKTIAAPKR